MYRMKKQQDDELRQRSTHSSSKSPASTLRTSHYSSSSITMLSTLLFLTFLTFLSILTLTPTHTRADNDITLSFASPKNGSWSPRSKGCLVVQDDTLVLVAGYANNIPWTNDVYQWQPPSAWSGNVVDSSKGFPGRHTHGCTLFQGLIYLAAGWNGKEQLNDVWTSSDKGVTWSEAPQAGFAPRQHPTLLVAKDKLWLIGGSSPEFDIWNTGDGKSWNQVTINGDVPARRISPALAYLNNQIWMIGGFSNVALNDVYTFDDSTGSFTSYSDLMPGTGDNNEAVTFGAHTQHNNKLYITGGTAGQSYGDTSRTEETRDIFSWDGTSWSRSSLGPNAFVTTWPMLMSYRQTLVMMGGDAGPAAFYNDVFVSGDKYLIANGGGSTDSSTAVGGGGGTTSSSTAASSTGTDTSSTGTSSSTSNGGGTTDPSTGGVVIPPTSSSTAAPDSSSTAAGSSSTSVGGGDLSSTNTNTGGGDGGSSTGTAITEVPPGAGSSGGVGSIDPGDTDTKSSSSSNSLLPVIIVIPIVALLLLLCLILYCCYRRRQRDRATKFGGTEADLENGDWLSVAAKKAAANKKKQTAAASSAGGASPDEKTALTAAAADNKPSGVGRTMSLEGRPVEIQRALSGKDSAEGSAPAVPLAALAGAGVAGAAAGAAANGTSATNTAPLTPKRTFPPPPPPRPASENLATSGIEGSSNGSSSSASSLPLAAAAAGGAALGAAAASRGGSSSPKRLSPAQPNRTLNPITVPSSTDATKPAGVMMSPPAPASVNNGATTAGSHLEAIEEDVEPNSANRFSFPQKDGEMNSASMNGGSVNSGSGISNAAAIGGAAAVGAGIGAVAGSALSSQHNENNNNQDNNNQVQLHDSPSHNPYSSSDSTAFASQRSLNFAPGSTDYINYSLSTLPRAHILSAAELAAATAAAGQGGRAGESNVGDPPSTAATTGTTLPSPSLEVDQHYPMPDQQYPDAMMSYSVSESSLPSTSDSAYRSKSDMGMRRGDANGGDSIPLAAAAGGVAAGALASAALAGNGAASKTASAASSRPSSTSSSPGHGLLSSRSFKHLVSSLDISRDEIQLGEQIGRGGFGTVFKAKYRGVDAAVKMIHSNNAGDSSELMAAFERELAVMCSVHNNRLIQIYGACRDPAQPFVVMEYMSRGSLYDVLHGKNKLVGAAAGIGGRTTPSSPITLTPELKLQMSIQILEGLTYMHSCRPPMLHTDIKSHNILIDSSWNVKIADFGFSQLLATNGVSSSLASIRGLHSMSSLGLHNGNSNDNKNFPPPALGGTLAYLPPEALGEEVIPPDKPLDCYAAGVVLWELFTGRIPWMGLTFTQILCQVGLYKKSLPVTDEIPVPMQKIIRSLFQERQMRPSALEVLEQLKQIDPTDLAVAGSSTSTSATPSVTTPQ